LLLNNTCIIISNMYFKPLGQKGWNILYLY
jgi:hypothetical protein